MSVSKERNNTAFPENIAHELNTACLQSSAEPLYSRVAAVLAHAIRDGRLAPETLLPSNAVLAERTRIAPSRINAAISSLVTQGLVVRAPGVGTIVLDARESTNPTGIYEELPPNAGDDITRRVAVVTSPLHDEGGERATEPASIINRTLFRKGQCIAHLSSEVPISAALLEKHDVSSIGLYRTLEFLRLTPKRVTQSIVARAVRPHERLEFAVSSEACILELTRVTTTQNGKCVETATHRYLADHFSVRSTLLQ
ncbi:GntR family transcriptional regulator [Pseudoclavibacter sp. Z016]|uniref:GntR family transcriptional regulator n=1 Tax=Pseudoclavibacter sp. Z016 TaxID=2080581 RepID=UPI0015E3C538|nr:GntR family transcriptional regulator [Pseudoclavibacter sp. Z016]